jgi:hypothetical protein
MDQFGIFDSIESAECYTSSSGSFRAPETATFPMARLQAWAGLAASMASRLDHVPSQREYSGRH